ncbi:MAG: GNAT family N-acetyltransferase [Candidatus Sumerlaeota bacterium]|nr:GNAT family N-acetyltransferase [Candidatus Sumerlaeota bacterium]
MEIRRIRREDAPVWARQRTDLWPDDGHEREIEAFFTRQLAEPEEVLVAVDAAEGIVGFVELSVRCRVEGCSTDRVGYVEGLYVVPRWREKGAARALLRASVGWACQRGCREFASDRSDRVIVDRRFR